MSAINTLRTVTIRQISEGADKARSDLEGTSSAYVRLAEAANTAAGVTETAVKRQLSAASAYDKLSAAIDPAVRSQQQMERGTRTLDRALQQGIITVGDYEKRLGQLQARHSAVATSAVSAADKTKAAWASLGSAGEAVSKSLAPMSKLSSLSSDGSVRLLGQATAGKAANENGRLRGDQVQNLTANLIDVGVSAQGGMNPLTILMQQGGQIAPIFTGPGGASVKGAFEQASEAASGFLGKIGPVGLGIAGAAALATTGAVALLSYASAQKELERSLSGTGRASGATVGGINALAPEAGRAAGVSTAAAREMAGAFAATGRIGTEMYVGLVKEARNYALVTGTDATEAAKLFAEAFADPEKGAEDLNKSLGFLSFQMLENIRAMQQSGDRLGAQKLLMQGVATATSDANAKLGFFSRQWQEFKTNTSNEVDAIGGFLSRGFGLDDAESRLKALQKQLDFRTSRMGTAGGLFDALLGFDIDTIKADITKVQAEIDRAASGNKKSYLDQRSIEIGQLVKQLNPATTALETLQRMAANFQKSLNEGVPDPLGSTKRAMDGLLLQAKQFTSDMAAGGAAYADSLRASQLANRTVGFTGLGQSAAQINAQAENSRVEALRAAGTNTDTDAYRNALKSIETKRLMDLDTLTKTTTEAEVKLGGAFSRFSADTQRQIVAAGVNSGTVTPSLIAAIAGKESSGNANVGYAKSLGADGRPSTSYGLGQINEGTAADAIRRGFLPRDYDRMDPARGAEGIAGVLKMKLKDANGDEDRAIMNYFGNPSEAKNRDYLASVRRIQGQMGDATVGGLAKDQDALTRAQRDSGQSLDALKKYYGENGAALETAQRQQAKYNELLDRGVPAQEAANIAYGGLIAKTTEFEQQAKLFRFSKDMQFDRDQLGRSAPEANAYARARSALGDTSTPAAQQMIGEIKATNELVDAKNAATGALQGFAQDLRAGVSPLQALGNAAGRAADSLINKLIDSVVSSSVGAVGKGGLGSLFGFATGGIMTSNGPLPLHAYATGGVANSPQLALFGEGRGPEAFVPLPDGKRIPVAMSGPANSNSSGRPVMVQMGNTVMNVTPAEGVTPAQLQAVLVQERAESARTFGQTLAAWKENN